MLLQERKANVRIILKQLTKVKEFPFNRRESIRTLYCAAGIPKSTLVDIFKRGNTIKHTSFKPLLTYQKQVKESRVLLIKMRPDRNFEDLYNYVHLDKSGFI